MSRSMIVQGLPKMALFLLLVVGVAVAQNIFSLLAGTLVGMGREEMLLKCLQENHGALPLALFIVPPVGAGLITLINPYIVLLFF